MHDLILSTDIEIWTIFVWFAWSQWYEYFFN